MGVEKMSGNKRTVIRRANLESASNREVDAVPGCEPCRAVSSLNRMRLIKGRDQLVERLLKNGILKIERERERARDEEV